MLLRNAVLNMRRKQQLIRGETGCPEGERITGRRLFFTVNLVESTAFKTVLNKNIIFDLKKKIRRKRTDN